MASGIFAILDDIAALMDDVAIATKVAAKKTAAILGDDLAVNAEKATGYVSSRELPVLWKITKGAFINKVIIVPIALVLSIYAPSVMKYALILGGFYLAYEGVEKIIEYLFHKKQPDATASETLDISDTAAENAKVKSAIITDFILSIEIIIIALSNVKNDSFAVKAMAVSAIAIIATVGVYGLVALIVRMDDLGYLMIKKSDNKGFGSKVGKMLVNGLPLVIKALALIGTVALILVSGGIFDHEIELLHHALPTWPSLLKQIMYALVAGLILVGLVTVIKKVFVRKKVTHK